MPPPKIQTYHCHCTTLLLASTHTLTTLPRRTTSSSPDIILPLPSSPPAPSEDPLPPSGYTLLLALTKDNKAVIIRREDGFEKRVLYRCERCRVVIGYEIVGLGQGQGEKMDVDGEGEEGEYRGQVMYLLPGGILGTSVMGGNWKGKRIGEEDVDIRSGGVAVFE
ncbi:uncharacterized protein LY89DRAFT_787505 [Mollisia scopiformis]|uniref:STEEP1 domain-containing protein n=1 Tax=Mollisia scopiformis TaxID=149040 RepID=A0A132BEQ6_MOLSC|nr:uncharacterized protein LY89DRAFT_787505 [Mollisia scopiformis]KUJ10489.1 hypothetical protein LY89DRAFT_787505 [Mollisia scopiformis]